MKKLYYSIFILLFLSLASCENFMDIHEEYIKDGEIMYAPKVDSIQFIAGKGRMEFIFWLYKSPNVKTVNLYWNAQRDSLIIPVTPTTGRDSLYKELPDFPEGAYTFNAKTIDGFGNSSLMLTGFGNSYGELFQNSLQNRRIKSITSLENGGAIDWFSSLEGMVRTEVKYMTKDNKYEILAVNNSAPTLLCANAKPGSDIEFRSLFIPEELSIDTFAVAWTKYEDPFPTDYKYDRSKWTVLEVSDETASDGGGKASLIDDKLNTWWHSSYTGGNAPLPHWAVIDMTSAKKIKKLNVYRRPGNKDAKMIQIFVGPDADASASTWYKAGEATFAADKDNIEVIIPDSQVTLNKGQYLKLVVSESNRDPFSSIAEIYVYGD